MNGSDLLALLDRYPHADEHRPWPRFILDRKGWQGLVESLSGHDAWVLLGLWSVAADVNLALRDEASGDIAVASLACPERRFPAVSPMRPAALRLERAILDLFGLEAEGSPDGRPWLDHGRWRQRQPLSAAPLPADPSPPAYDFLPVEGESIHQIPVGPVHAGIIEPGHFRFHANGETVVRLEERLGYVHKGIEGLMAGRDPLDAARLAGRISGDSTVAHALAFARAVEAALDTSAPPRADWVRAIMAELERLANHFGDIGAICNDATFPFMLAQMSMLRERILRAASECFGHRLMMDRVMPGGVGADLSLTGATELRRLVQEIRPRFAELVAIYDNKPSLLDRTVGTGITPAALVHRFGAGGHVGRAAGRAQDARRSPGYPPYDQIQFAIPVFAEGDVNARLLVRAREVEASLSIIEQLLDQPPGGPAWTALPQRGGEGMALVESFRGEILTWVRLGPDGRVRRCHPRDPSWFQWPLLEAAIEGNIVADFPLCNKSFNCTYSGHDL